MRTSATTVFASLTLLTVLGASAGCSLVVGGDAGETADKLAASLSSHSLDGLELTAESGRERFAAAVAGMVDVPVTVSVDEVDAGDESAAVSLSWSWELGKEDWRYTTTATLKDAAGVWELDWEPSMLAPGLRSGERLSSSRDQSREVN